MIDAIYTSKLYRTSKRKSAIVSAANSPMNTELVTQLADALSPVYRKEEYLVDKKTEEAKAAAQEDRKAEETAETKVQEESHSTNPKKAESHIADEFRKAEKHEEKPVEEAKPAEDENPTSAESSANTENLKAVTATRALTFDVKQLVDELKNLLNLKDSTAGVNRILAKDSEIWIYYNDNINLNNVMAAAIESLNASGYTYLEFNRLARSDNAMVFQMMFKDTDNELKSIDNKEED